MIKIRTNNAWRNFLYREEVPAEILASQFDWTNEAYAKHGDYGDGFIAYRGAWYHVSEFMRGGVEGWDGRGARGTRCAAASGSSHMCAARTCLPRSSGTTTR